VYATRRAVPGDARSADSPSGAVGLTSGRNTLLRSLGASSGSSGGPGSVSSPSPMSPSIPLSPTLKASTTSPTKPFDELSRKMFGPQCRCRSRTNWLQRKRFAPSPNCTPNIFTGAPVPKTKSSPPGWNQSVQRQGTGIVNFTDDYVLWYHRRHNNSIILAFLQRLSLPAEIINHKAWVYYRFPSAIAIW
jgi:hypothetical protein